MHVLLLCIELALCIHDSPISSMKLMWWLPNRSVPSTGTTKTVVYSADDTSLNVSKGTIRAETLSVNRIVSPIVSDAHFTLHQSQHLHVPLTFAFKCAFALACILQLYLHLQF